MVLFTLAATTLVVVAEVLGTQQLSAASAAAASQSAERAMQVVLTAAGPINQLLVGLGAGVVGPLLYGFNDSIMSVVNLNGTYTALLAAQSAIVQLPDVPATVALLAGMAETTPLLLANASALQADINDFAASRATLLPRASQLRGNLSVFAAGRPRLRAAAVWVRGNASDVMAFQATLCAASGSGSALAAQSDLAAAARSPAGGLPTVAALHLATGADGGTGGTLDQLVRHRPDIDGNDARIAALIANLQALQAPLASLPNFATTAARLSAIAASIRTFGGSSRTLAQLSASMDAAVALAAAVPAPSTLTEQLSGVSGALAAFSLLTLQRHLVDLNATLATFPPMAPLLYELHQLQALEAALPSLRQIGTDLAAINASVLQLPASYAAVSSMFAAINGTVGPVLQQLSSVEASVSGAAAQLATLHIDSIVADVGGAAGSIASHAADLNVTSFSNQLAAVGAAITLNFTAPRAELSALSTALAGYSFDAAAGSALTSLQSTLDDVSARLHAAVGSGSDGFRGEYLLYRMGYCSTAPAASFCSSDADCSAGGVCTGQGISRCSASPSVGCTTDADCGAGATDRCLTDTTRASALQLALDALAQPSAVPDTSAQATSVASAAAGCSVNVSALSVSMDGAVSQLDGLAVDAYLPLLSALPASLAAVDAETLRSTIASLAVDVAAVGSGALQAQVGALAATVTDLRDDKAPLVTAAATSVLALNSLLTLRMPAYLRRLRLSALQSTLAVAGPSALVEEVLGIPQEVADLLSDSGGMMAALPQLPLMSAARPFAELLDRAAATGAYADARVHGGLHYFAQLAAPNSTMRSTDPSNKLLLSDKTGARYPGGRICLTRACLQDTMDALLLEPYTASNADRIGFSLPPLPISPRWLLLLLWVPPVIVVIFAVWALLAPLCCRAPEWQKVPSAWVTGLSVCQVPVVLLLSTAALAALIVVEDACVGAPNVGYNYLLSWGDDLCTGRLQGSGSLQSCALSPDLSPLGATSFNATVSLTGQYAAFFGQGCSSASDPFAELISQVVPGVARLPSDVATFLLFNSASPVYEAGLGPSLRAVAVTAASQLGTLLSTTLVALGSSTLSCSTLSTAVAASQAAVCDTLMKPVFWYLSMWYLMGWLLLLCAVPAGLLGRKRLPSGPWGPAYLEVLKTTKSSVEVGKAAKASGKSGRSSAKVTPSDGVDDAVFGKRGSKDPAASSQSASSPASAHRSNSKRSSSSPANKSGSTSSGKSSGKSSKSGGSSSSSGGSGRTSKGGSKASAKVAPSPAAKAAPKPSSGTPSKKPPSSASSPAAGSASKASSQASKSPSSSAGKRK